ncbi:MAG: thiamine pyrophosphate-binding protein [Candidatus Brocadiae bacterium]|nr:thiamine pyrophosphate-binding protein [Candidatus Brocadiia bacterium]
MNVADLIVRYLEDIGVERVFFLPGGPVVPLTEAFWKSSKIKLICSNHETGAAFMAYGYAWSRNTLGVCCVTAGPGTTNAITGIATARLDRVPLLIISAMNSIKYFSKKPAQDSSPYDGIDTVGIYEKFTCYSKMITSAEEAGYVMQNAIKIAFLNQGPVHVSLPTDIGFQEIFPGRQILQPGQYLPQSPKVPEIKEIQRASQALCQAQKPLLFIGHDAVQSNAFEEIRNLAETLCIPVMTTAKAKGSFPEKHPLSLGVYGFSSSYQAIQYLKEKHDVLVSLGVEFHENSTDLGSELLMPSKCFIQINSNPLYYGNGYPGDIGLIGNIKEILSIINQTLPKDSLDPNILESRKNFIQATKAKVSRFRDPEKLYSASSPIKPQRLLKDIEDSFPEDTVYVVDAGSSFLWSSHFLTLQKPRTFLISTRHAPMGFSIASIGCKCAFPKTPVVAIIGDGSMKMQGMEIATAVNNQLPVVFVVLNDSRWGAIHFGYELLGLKVDLAKSHSIDFAKLAESLGAIGVTIRKPGEIHKELIDKLLGLAKPVVLDVYIDPKECPPFGARIEAMMNHNAKIHSEEVLDCLASKE